MRRRGFTLVELLIVMVIIGILMTFILKAAMGGIRRAEEKATIALIAKLEQAMTDRWDALTTYQADPTPAHYSLAAIYNGSNPRIESTQRAQVIAQYDYLRSQVPDVFLVNSGSTTYPINFAGAGFGENSDFGYQLPFGNATAVTSGGSGNPGPGTGVHGAAYEIAAGIYKQLGYGPKGYDGSDNDRDGLVDEMGEGGMTSAEVYAKLGRHQHKTARAEMLYAILVEGAGPYGSSFDKDDFTSKEVQDTDGDGLLEFVDAWGEPLQFYRWPILYRSDLQKGFPDVAKLTLDLAASRTPGPYTSAYETREQNPLDPNQTLLAPAWWGGTFNSAYPAKAASGGLSGAAITFMEQFGPCLLDPCALNSAAASNSSFWDRSTTTTTGYYTRRAYYSRFLILSGGPDKNPGTAQLGVNYKGIDDRSTINIPGGTAAYSNRDGSGGGVGLSIANLLLESQGGHVDLNRNSLGKLTIWGAGGRNDTNSQLEDYGLDDITSQNLQATGGALQ